MRILRSATVLILILPMILCFPPPQTQAAPSGPIIIDHTCTDIWQIPESAIEQAKNTLHIAYGHTSHGSQLISGMGSSGTQLDTFMTNNGATPGTYVWNDGPQAGALDLDDYFVSGDLGNPDRITWAQRTRDYLDNPANSDVNVIIWSWCGQVNGSEDDIDLYLSLMNQLEIDYTDVMFVYMTGHLDGTGDTGNVNIRNNQIRDYCIANNKILYDFADIESYDPDGLVHYMPLRANDNCDYDSDDNGSLDSNWALDWQSTHTEGIDWWASGAAHSQHLNGNLKGYAAWWLWATLAGWNQCTDAPSNLEATADSEAQEIALSWIDNSSNEDSYIIQRQVDGGAWDNSHDSVGADSTSYVDTGLPIGTYSYRVVAHLDDDGTGNPCDSPPSNTATDDIVSTDPPAAPSGLDATGDSQNRYIALSWTDNSSNETGFTIQRQVGVGTWDNSYDTVGANITTYDDLNLDPGEYNYRIIAYNPYDDSPPSNEADAVILDIPLSPTNLEAVGDSGTATVSLTWTDNSDNETGFIIQRQVDGGGWNDSHDTVAPNVITYDDGPGLPNGTYNYRIVAYNGNGNSNPSNDDSAIISTSAPEAPSNLTSTLNAFDVDLSWTDNSDNEENFVLERQVDGGAYSVLDDTIPANTESYSDTGLAPLHTYTYRLKASNNYGDSGYSNETSEYIAEETFVIDLKQGVDGYTGCEDAYLKSDNPTNNYGGTLYTYVLNSPKSNLVVSFDMPAQLMDKKIIEATIGFYCWSISSWQDNQYLTLYQITEEWEEGSANGSYQQGSSSWDVRGDGLSDIAWSTPGGTHDTQLLGSSLIPNNGYYPEFDVTDLTQEWVDGTTPNYGVLLKNDTPVTTGIKSSEYGEYGRPYMEIIYTNKPSPSDIELSVELEGADRPLSGYIIPLTTKFFEPGSDPFTEPALYEFTMTTMESGGLAVCQLTDIPAGTYDIIAVSEHTLMNIKRNVLVSSPVTTVHMGTLLEGNANDDTLVSIIDFSILSASYMTSVGDEDYDARADFDRNDTIDIRDFGLLAKNYSQESPIEIA